MCQACNRPRLAPGLTIADASTQTVDGTAVNSTPAVEGSSTTSFPLLSLPAELRSKIFDCFFQGRSATVKCQDPDCSSNQCGVDREQYADEDEEFHRSFGACTSITQVSKMVRDESTSSLLRNVCFNFELLDNHSTWTPSDTVRAHIARMKYLRGPPRLLHYLGLATLRFVDPYGRSDTWVRDCTAERVACDIMLDRFDIEDAVTKHDSNEALFFRGARDAIKGPKGSRLLLSLRVEDSDDMNNPDIDRHWDARLTSAIQVWKQKVFLRRKPRSEEGKIKLRTVLKLLGLDLRGEDRRFLEPARQDTPSDNANGAAGTNTAINSSVVTPSLNPTPTAAAPNNASTQDPNTIIIFRGTQSNIAQELATSNDESDPDYIDGDSLIDDDDDEEEDREE